MLNSTPTVARKPPWSDDEGSRRQDFDQPQPNDPDGKKTREEPHKVSPSWVLVYRDLCEWAVLYDRICYHTFASDTLIVRDGLLRSKLFRGELFSEFRKKLETAITRVREKDRRQVFLVGIAKQAK